MTIFFSIFDQGLSFLEKMRPTPDYSCWYKYSDDVYEPSEDTFIFLDGIDSQLESKKLVSGLAVEIGCGSGLVSVSFSKWVNCPVVSIDINKTAAKCARSRFFQDHPARRFLGENLVTKVRWGMDNSSSQDFFCQI